MIRFAAGRLNGNGESMKIGILGGTFDPVHNGHLEIAREVEKELGLDKMLFMPAGQSPFKLDYEVTPAEQRMEMLRLALEEKPDYEISKLEIERPGVSYTVDTLTELKQKFGDNRELYFIMGRDSLARFAEWREPSRVIEIATLVAIPRPGCEKPDLEKLNESVPGLSSRVILLDRPLIDISSTSIREKAARGEALSGSVPKPVEKYIKQQELYRK